MIRILQCFLVFFAFNVMNGQVFSEDFTGVSGVANSFSLGDWDQFRDDDDNYANGSSNTTGGAWAADTFNNESTSDAIRINMTNNVKLDWLTTPLIDLSATPASGSYFIEWDMAFSINNESTFQALNEGDEIRLLISKDGGDTFTSLALYDSNTIIAEGGESFSIELSDNSYFVDNVQVAFYAFESDITTNATNVFIDNLVIADETLSTTDLTISEGFDLYPNPTTDDLYVKNVQLSEVQLFTLIGRKIDVEYSGSTIHTSALAAGTYIVKLTDDKGYTHTSKFIKK